MSEAASAAAGERAAALAEGLAQLYRNPWLAHRTLFPHRHPEASAPCHREIVALLHDPVPRAQIEGFRGVSKTTLAEEAILLRAAFRMFRNLVIVGSSYTRACDRLVSIKAEIEINDALTELFGSLKGPIWQEGRVVLSNGICIQALGREQSTLGIKFNDVRPDAFLIDDVEDPNEKRTDPERAETWNWFLRVFQPSLDDPVLTWGRALGTRRGTGSMAERLEKIGWTTKKFPIEYLDPTSGERKATWPGKFPLAKIDQMKQDYRSELGTWDEEFMCRSTAASDRVFTRDVLRCEPRSRSWQSVSAMYDPARTTGRQSATTGKAVWSWIGPRLVFWEVKAEQWLPDQIIADMFDVAERFDPTWIGFEKDGLDEWALQPIRTEMLRRRVTLPLLPVNAPKDKYAFIRGLQPYMRAGEVTFAGPPEEFSDAIDQFLSFPQRRIDAPNACAYALLLRPGAPVYDGFTEASISEELGADSGRPAFLAANSDGAIVTAALLQRVDGEIRIIADWVREGSPTEVAADIHSEANLAAETVHWQERVEYGEGENQFKLPVRRMVQSRRPIQWIVPQWHRETYRNVGLVQAIRAIPQAVSIGADNGQSVVRDLLSRTRQGRPALVVSPTAKWTLRGFVGGYARPLGSRGLAAAQPDAGIYRLLMEGIEAFAAVGAAVEPDESADQQPIAFTRQGVAYRSAMPDPQGHQRQRRER